MRIEVDAEPGPARGTALGLIGASSLLLVALFVLVAWAVVPVEMLLLAHPRPVTPGAAREVGQVLAPLGLLAAASCGVVAASVMLLAVVHSVVRRVPGSPAVPQRGLAYRASGAVAGVAGVGPSSVISV